MAEAFPRSVGLFVATIILVFTFTPLCYLTHITNTTYTLPLYGYTYIVSPIPMLTSESTPTSRWLLASSTMAGPTASGQGLAGSGGGGGSQEVTFILALALLLRSGLTAAAEATTFVGEPVEYEEGDQASSYFLQVRIQGLAQAQIQGLARLFFTSSTSTATTTTTFSFQCSPSSPFLPPFLSPFLPRLFTASPVTTTSAHHSLRILRHHHPQHRQQQQ